MCDGDGDVAVLIDSEFDASAAYSGDDAIGGEVDAIAGEYPSPEDALLKVGLGDGFGWGVGVGSSNELYFCVFVEAEDGLVFVKLEGGALGVVRLDGFALGAAMASLEGSR